MKIALLGDIGAFGRCCVEANPSLLSELEPVAAFLRQHDLVIGNLEAPFVDDEAPLGHKSAHIKSRPANIALLRHLGVTHVTLANNHIFDFGLAGYRQTLGLLEDARIDWFGAEGRSVKLDFRGEKITLLGYCSLTSNPSQLKFNGKELLNLFDVDLVIQDMQACRDEGRLPIVAVHSGMEHIHTPSSEDVAFARLLADRFAYVYYGHHPHVVQGHERIGGSQIFYSLGNFLFDDVYTPKDSNRPLVAMSEANRLGVVASLEVVGGEIRSSQMHPVYLATNGISFGREIGDFDPCQHNDALKGAGNEAYDAERAAILSDYAAGRRKRRDLNWYLARLNLNSVGMIAAAHSNARRHRRIFSTRIQELVRPQ